MSQEQLRDAAEERRERLLRLVRVALLLSLLPWISIPLRSAESARFLVQLGVGGLAAILAVRYYRRGLAGRAPARYTASNSLPVRTVANFVLGYGEFLVAFYAFIAILGLFGIIDHFVG